MICPSLLSTFFPSKFTILIVGNGDSEGNTADPNDRGPPWPKPVHHRCSSGAPTEARNVKVTVDQNTLPVESYNCNCLHLRVRLRWSSVAYSKSGTNNLSA